MSQCHTKIVADRKKAQVHQQSMLGYFGLKIEAVAHRLTPDNVSAILGGAVLVIDCTDNAAARRCIQAFVRQEKIPCLHGCLSATGDFARVVWDEIFTEDEEGTEGAATCENGDNLPFHALAAAQIAVNAQVFLKTGVKRSMMLLPDKSVRIA